MSNDVTNFEIDVIQQSFQIPVLVDFWAEWCGPCKSLGPILERLAEQQHEKWTLAKVNTEVLLDVAATYGIRSIPHVILFSEGKQIGEFVGALPEYTIVQWLKKNVPRRNNEKVSRAVALVDNHQQEEAKILLQEVVRKEPDNSQARTVLAKLSVYSDPSIAFQLIQDIDDPNHSELANGIRVILRLFDILEQPDLLPDDAIKPEYLSAIQDLHEQRFDKALEKFVGIIRHNRKYDDDGSRKACIAIFKYLGEDHPLTAAYRRDFSRALY